MDRRMHRTMAGCGRETAFARGHRLKIIGAVIGLATRREMAQPMMVEMDARHFDAEIAEGVEIAVVRAAPALELDAALDRTLSRPEEFGRIEAKIALEIVDRRAGRLTDADSSTP